MNKAFNGALKSATLQLVVKQPMNKHAAEPNNTDALLLGTISVPYVTVLVAKYVENEVNKRRVDMAKIEEPFVKLTIAGDKRNRKTEKDFR